jgi:hypothetical protein
MLTLGLSACEREGPAERTGEKVDEMSEKAGKFLEDAGDQAKEKAQR